LMSEYTDINTIMELVACKTVGYFSPYSAITMQTQNKQIIYARSENVN